ncbi:hypothetical protein TWF481_009574 [Arthrobotrys musiformis]|uniref:Protein kinase domain-containing protein n=1 Tax=Arthrobotrys musiformis TaxID=47236 RepID=A0AAV9W6A2_9PEZI
MATETVGQLLARPLPKILFTSGTRCSSGTSKTDRVDRKFLFHWEGFLSEVAETIRKADLTKTLTVTDPTEGELIMVGNKHGLTGSFQANVGVVLGRVFHSSVDENLVNLRFGDSQTAFGSDDKARSRPKRFDRRRDKAKGRGEADILIVAHTLETEEVTCRVVGKIKIYWTQPLVGSAISSSLLVPAKTKNVDPRSELEAIEGPVGQLVRHMIYRNIKYGFLSTYEYTIFLRRMGRMRFEITDPIKFDSTDPTVRQCFYHMGKLGASDEFSYTDEEPDITLKILQSGDSWGEDDTSPRRCRLKRRAPEDKDNDQEGDDGKDGGGGIGAPSKKLRTRAATTEPSEFGSMTKNSPSPSRGFIGRDPESDDEGGTASATSKTKVPKEIPMFNLQDITLNSIIFGENMVSRHVFQVQEALPDDHEKGKKILTGLFNNIKCIVKYENEKDNYLRIPTSRYFPKMMAFGDIVLGQEFREGHIIVLSKEKGEPLDYEMIQKIPRDERVLMYNEIVSAVTFIRAAGLRHGDPKPWNILWDKESGQLILLDFEIMRPEDKDRPANEWEVAQVFGSYWTPDDPA